MGGKVELWSLRRFSGAAIRFDWFGRVKRSRQAGAVLPYLAISCQCLAPHRGHRPRGIRASR